MQEARAWFFERQNSHMSPCSVRTGSVTEPLLVERGEDTLIVLPEGADARAFLVAFILGQLGLTEEALEDEDDRGSVERILEGARL